ncbi:MAG: outer membrane protein assembly factor BamD [Bacteroidetes bacterium]|nr:MAG: outer membrane protein assembly factor BamD [Bacteroidota bacterium]
MKRSIVPSIIFITVFALMFGACSSSKEVENIPAEERYRQAKELFDDEKYLEAIEEFKIVIVQYQGSEYADEAQFYLAECRYLRGEYILAAAEYDNLVRTMPTSPYTPLARYKKALSHYELSPKPQLDQKYSRFAIDDFQTYIEYSPQDSMVADSETKIRELTEKLSRKLFESGRLYFRMEYYRAAIAYFEKVTSEYNDTPFADDAMLWKARAHNARKDFAAARVTLDDLGVRYPGSDLAPDIAELRTQIAEDEAEHQESLLARKNLRNE